MRLAPPRWKRPIGAPRNPPRLVPYQDGDRLAAPLRVVKLAEPVVGCGAPRFESRVLVLTAQEIVDHAIQAVIGDAGTLGLVVPLAEQEAEMREKLRHITSNVVAVSASPYAADEGVKDAAEQLDQYAPDLVVLYCIGFNQTHRRIFRQVTGKPVIVANSLLSRTLAELLEP